eukprot:986242-Alexandrium_andersonii.AAC.1
MAGSEELPALRDPVEAAPPNTKRARGTGRVCATTRIPRVRAGGASSGRYRSSGGIGRCSHT